MSDDVTFDDAVLVRDALQLIVLVLVEEFCQRCHSFISLFNRTSANIIRIIKNANIF